MVEAGVTWAQLTDAAAVKGKMPPAMPDYMHLSIGGTVSVGGIGGTVGKYGLAVDTIESIDIVTGAGQLLTASPVSAPTCSTRRWRAAVRWASSSASR